MEGNKQSIFQIALLGLFGVMAVIGVIVIAINKGTGGNQFAQVPLTIWGPPFDDDILNRLFVEIGKDDKVFENITYIEKNPYTLYGDLLEAIATGRSPDLVLMNSNGLLPLKNKLYPISFDTIPLQTYKDTYVDGAEIFITDGEIFALPLFVDPLVLYWNKDLFTSAAIAQVPKDWDTFVQVVPRLSVIIGGADLQQSAIAFGEYDNVLHAKEILSALMMQTGASIVKEAKEGYVTDIHTTDYNTVLALSFYTSFSNPVKTVYSWNKTFDRSREAFAANKVAMYGGLVSEESILGEINPNLNYGISIWPQSNNTHTAVTHGSFYGIAVLKQSSNPYTALYVAQVLASKDIATKLAERVSLPSTRRDVLANLDTSDPFAHTKTQSAIMAKSWLEPAPRSAVDEAFARTINGVVSGSVTPDTGMTQFGLDLTTLLKPYQKKP